MTALSKRKTSNTEVKTEQTNIGLEFLEARPVVTRAWKTLEIYLIGCGGTGSWLAPSLARLARVMRDAGKTVRLVFVDPEHVEAANVPRQNFCAAELGLPKASTLALRYGMAWGVDIHSIVAPFEARCLNMPHGVPSETLVVLVGCVDNAAARRSISEVLGAHNAKAAHMLGRDEPPPVWWLDCGNHKEAGQILLGTASTQQELEKAFTPSTICRALPSPALQRPELLEALPDEQSAITGLAELSCAQLSLLSVQSLMVNQNIAAVAADYMLRLVMAGGLKKFATYIDLPSGVAKSFYTTPVAVVGAIAEAVAEAVAG